MKKIEAIINPFKLDEVKHALIDSGVGGMTTAEVDGYSANDVPVTMSYRGTAYVREFRPQVKIDVVVTDEQAAAALAIIAEAAHGAGHIFVSSVEEVIRIRTGERGVRALNGATSFVGTQLRTSHEYPVFADQPAGIARAH